MRIFGWCQDFQACGTYRVGMPLQELRAAYDDIESTASTAILIDEARNSDLVVGQRIEKESNSLWWQIQAATGRPLIFEIDDNLWHVHPSSPAHKDWSNPQRLARLTRNAQVASAVTVSTPHLAEAMSALNPNVHVLTNCIPGELLEHERPRAERLTVGWAGSPTHLPDLMVAAEPLTRFFSKYPGWDMHFMGTDYSHLIKHRSRVTGWVNGVKLFHRTIDFDIGLAPLADNEFNRSKSAIRALELAALGIPIVASDVGPYRDFVQHGVTGFLCRYEHEWFKYLRLLAEDADLRATMGGAAKAQAAQHTISGNIWRWRQVYDTIGVPDEKPWADDTHFLDIQTDARMKQARALYEQGKHAYTG